MEDEPLRERSPETWTSLTREHRRASGRRGSGVGHRPRVRRRAPTQAPLARSLRDDGATGRVAARAPPFSRAPAFFRSVFFRGRRSGSGFRRLSAKFRLSGACASLPSLVRPFLPGAPPGAPGSVASVRVALRCFGAPRPVPAARARNTNASCVRPMGGVHGLARPSFRRPETAATLSRSGRGSLSGRGRRIVCFEKIRVFQAGSSLLHGLAWDN